MITHSVCVRFSFVDAMEIHAGIFSPRRHFPIFRDATFRAMGACVLLSTAMIAHLGLAAGYRDVSRGQQQSGDNYRGKTA
jgi:hypothetical protein